MLVALVMVIAMCGCSSSSEEIKDKLIRNPWYGSIDYGEYWASIQLSFSNDDTVKITDGFGVHSDFEYVPPTHTSFRGTYVIEDEEIVITYDSGVNEFIKYTYEDGNLTMHMTNIYGDEVYFEILDGM